MWLPVLFPKTLSLKTQPALVFGSAQMDPTLILNLKDVSANATIPRTPTVLPTDVLNNAPNTLPSTLIPPLTNA